MKKLDLKAKAYEIARVTPKTEVYSGFYKVETQQEIVLVYGVAVVGLYSKRTGTLYAFKMLDGGVKNKLYAFARKINVNRIAHLYFRKDCVLETYIDNRPPWKVSKDIYYREYHNDFGIQIQNRW